MELLLHFIVGIVLSVVVAVLSYKLQSQLVSIAFIGLATISYIGLSYVAYEIVAVQFVIAGAVFGYVAQHFSFQRYITVSALVLWAALIVVYYMQYYMQGIDVVADNYNVIRQMVESSALGAAEKSLMLQQLENFVPTMRKLIPFSNFFSSVLISLFLYVLIYPIFVRFKFLNISDSTFSLFRIYEWFVFLFIASWAIVLFVDSSKILWAIALNIGLILCVVYTIQGLSILSYYFERKQWPRLYAILALVVAMLLGVQAFFFIVIMVMGLGIIDFWMNFRNIV